jgi:hypothetical protein
MAQRTYTTGLAKGQGIIQETLAILDVWQPHMSTSELVSEVLRKGVLSKATALRMKDLVNRVFAGRYLVDDGRPAQYLKRLRSHSMPANQLSQILLIYTARANPILHDFLREVYWKKYASGTTHLKREDALDFLESAVNNGCINRRWSPTTSIKVARYLLGCLEDFLMATPIHRGEREILPFVISPLTTLYLSHELHFQGLGDVAVLKNPDWALFGLEPHDVARELERVSFAGHFIVQYSGEILRIAWKYKTMEECLDGIAASEL